MIRTSLLAVAVLSIAAFSPAHAQNQDPAPTLRVDSGTVMTSDGGEFVSASSGATVSPGTRVMLAEDSRASLVYPNGCTVSIGDAGVHAVPAVCQTTGSQSAIGAGTATAGVDWASAGWLFLGTAAVAAGLASMDTEAAPPEYIPPPVSR